MVILDYVKLPFSFAPVNTILALCKKKKQKNPPKKPNKQKTKTKKKNNPMTKKTPEPTKRRQLWNLPMNQLCFKTKVRIIDDTWFE